MKTLSNKFWLILLGVILALCLAFTGYVYWRGTQVPEVPPIKGPVAVIYLDGRITDAVDLGNVEENYTKTYEGQSGNTNTVEFAPGRVRVQSATCPDRVCMGQGWIKEGDILPIACLPNSLIIEIVSQSDLEPEVDGATN